MAAALKARTEAARRTNARRSAERVLFMECAICGQSMRRWRSQVERAKLPMTCGAKACRSAAMSGANNPRSTGGTWVDKRHGYRHLRSDYLSVEDQVLLPTPRPRDVTEHRLVMARLLGRWPTPREHVHHMNGDKLDNRPENLTLMDWSAHSREHRAVLRRLTLLEAENQALRVALVEARS